MKKVKLFMFFLMLCGIGFTQHLPTKAGSTARAYVHFPSYNQGYIEFNTDNVLNTTMLNNEWHSYGGAYYDDRLYNYELDGSNNSYFQIIEPSTGKLLKKIPRSELNGLLIAAMSYDYSTGTMYALREKILYKVNLRTGELTMVSALTNVTGTWVQCMAIDLQGNMFVIDGHTQDFAYLYSVNKTTGNATRIGSTGRQATMTQSMAFDYNTGTLYWANFAYSSQINWYSVNTETGRPSLLEEGIGQYHGLYFVYSNFDGDAPGAVTGFAVTPGDLGALNANVTWKNPSRNYYGDPISSLTSVKVYVDDSLVYTKANPTTGATEQINISFAKAGDYDFKIVASNAAGDGKSTRKMLWIGRDVPAAPKNIVATYLGDNIGLEWEAPTAGLHAAYCDFTNMKYNIVRNPGRNTVATGHTGLTFTDNTISDIGVYTYSITAVNADGTGGTGFSNPSMGGGTISIPYTCSFETVNEWNMWPDVDSGGDGSWMASRSHALTGDYCILYNLGQQRANDWLFSPLMPLESGKKYKVSFGMRTVDKLPENLELYFTNGQNPTKLIGDRIWFKEGITHQDYIQYGAVVEISSTGNYGFAFRCYSDALQGYLCIDDFLVEEADGPADAAVTALYGATEPIAGEPFIYRAQISNVGLSSLSGYTVKLVDGTGNVLATAPGTEIAPLAQGNIKLSWIPANTGNVDVHVVVDYTGDPDTTNNISFNRKITVQAKTSAYAPNIGDGTIISYLTPFNFYFNTSWVQTIYYDFELIGREGFIDQIEYFNYFASDYSNGGHVRVYMANTTEASLGKGWLDTSNFELVFDGDVSFPIGENTIPIRFDTPFRYTGNNLVILTNRDFQNAAGHANNFFYSTQTHEDFPSRTRYYYSTMDAGDRKLPEAGKEGFGVTSDGVIVSNFPNIVITMGLSLGSASGKVTDGTNPVEGASVKISGSGRTRITDANGEYTFNYVTAGDYTFEASKKGYFPKTSPNVTVNGGVVATVPDLVLELIPTYSISGKVRSYDMPEGLDSVQIQLTGYDTTFTCMSDADGNFTVNGLPNTFTYEVTASKEGYSKWIGNITLEGANITDFDFMMTEIIYTAGMVEAEIVNDNAVINWLAAGSFIKTQYIFDDGTLEQGHRINAAYEGWFGNRFDVGESGLITGVEVMGYDAYMDAREDSVTIDIFDKNLNYVGTSKPFVMRDMEWVYADVPNLPYEGSFHAMVHWNKTENFTCFLGVDETGPEAGTGKDLRLMDGEWTKVMHGFFMIRITANSTGAIAGSNMPVKYGYDISGAKTGIVSNSTSSVKGLSITAPESSVFHRSVPTSKSLQSYDIYRIEPGDRNQADWTKLDSNLTVTTYTDEEWGSLANGWYQYAVVAKYSGDILSKPRLSDRVGKNVGVEANAVEKLFSVYPNPVKDVLNIQTNRTIVEIIIVDQTGRVVKVQKGDENIVRLHSLSKGNYVVSVRTDMGTSTVKIIKQ